MGNAKLMICGSNLGWFGQDHVHTESSCSRSNRQFGPQPRRTIIITQLPRSLTLASLKSTVSIYCIKEYSLWAFYSLSLLNLCKGQHRCLKKSLDGNLGHKKLGPRSRAWSSTLLQWFAFSSHAAWRWCRQIVDQIERRKIIETRRSMGQIYDLIQVKHFLPPAKLQRHR